MKPHDIKKKLSKQPFQAFTIHISDGRCVEITHPDQVMVFNHKLLIGLGRDKQGIMERDEDVAIQHITSLEELSKKSF